jgi:hypothetical protein
MSLLALQRDFRGWLDAEAADAAARIGVAAAPGLSVYLNNYRGQLMDCLRESFGTVRAWIGDAAFDSAAATHIERQAPYSWTLDAYALDFPRTLDLVYPDDPEVGELACLERELGLAFVGLDAVPLDRSTLADVDWEVARLELVPTLRIVIATTNAAAIWSSLMAGEQPPAAALLSEPTPIAVWRDGFAPTFRTLDNVEGDALVKVRDGATFGALCADLVAAAGEEEGAALAGGLLARWLGDGVVVRVGTRL